MILASTAALASSSSSFLSLRLRCLLSFAISAFGSLVAHCVFRFLT